MQPFKVGIFVHLLSSPNVFDVYLLWQVFILTHASHIEFDFCTYWAEYVPIT